MIHFFNPGNETAIVNASKYFQPAANQVKMQKELSFLPAWYASSSDFVLITEDLTPEFIQIISQLPTMATAISVQDFTKKKEILDKEGIGLWGIAPNSIHFFEKINHQNLLNLNIPEWKDIYIKLSSRITSHEILKELTDNIPEIENNLVPEYFTNIQQLEDFIINSKKEQLLKSPYSSSGRGLTWLPPGKLAQSEKQIISGILRRQKIVSVEKALDKQLDFSMHFEINKSGSITFLGYSIFNTNKKGAYEHSLLSSQQDQKAFLTSFIDNQLIEEVKNELLKVIPKTYSPYYSGNIGVDMLIYKSGNTYRLNPCIEVNMRKSMGYLALQLYTKFIHPLSKGIFSIEYNASATETYKRHQEWKKQYPLIIKDNLIESGYLSLCPVTTGTNYHAYIKIKMRSEK